MQRKLVKEIKATEKLTRNARQEVGQLQQRLLVRVSPSFRVYMTPHRYHVRFSFSCESHRVGS